MQTIEPEAVAGDVDAISCDTDLPADEKRRRARELWHQDPTITGVELSRRFGCEASWGRKQIAAARQQHAGQDAATQPARVPAIDNGPDDEPGTRDTPDVPRPAPPARHWIDTGTVLLVALVAAAASYGHMLEVALHAGEPVWLARASASDSSGVAGVSRVSSTMVTMRLRSGGAGGRAAGGRSRRW